MAIFPNDPVEAMEMAKDIIGGKIKVDPKDLVANAQDQALSKWQRIAAIYALGFSRENHWAPSLRHILGDSRNDADLRSYAAEALGNLRDRESAMLLKDILGHEKEPDLRRSCEYALDWNQWVM